MGPTIYFIMAGFSIFAALVIIPMKKEISELQERILKLEVKVEKLEKK